MTSILIQNVSAQRLSLDIPVPAGGIGEGHPKAIRVSLARGESVEVGDIITIDDLNRTVEFQRLLATGLISVVAAGEAADIDIPGALLAPHGAAHEIGSTDPVASLPTAGQKAALPGTNGAPGAGNPYVTNSDPRNADARVPTAHAASHTTVGTDPIAVGATTIAFHETFINPEAPATAKGTCFDNVLAGMITGQPSHPVNLEVVFPAGWLGGTINVFGTSASGLGTGEIFTDTSGGVGMTVVGGIPFATIATIANSAPGGAGAMFATVQTGTRLAVANPDAALSFYKLSANGLDEAIAASLPVSGLWTPTTAPNGANDYDIWYTVPHTHTVV